jgi:hypothetical protein
VPLSDFQARIARMLAVNRTPDSHLAGGAALHFEPNSVRYSNDLDYFHDSVERVATAFEADRQLLLQSAFTVSIEINLPGYIRARVAQQESATKIEWAHDSAWRFMPALYQEECGYRLHPVDLSINKVLALAGRDEARDFLDVLYIHGRILPLGALCWAAAGKDPGFTPLSLLELLRRRGKYRPEQFSRLMLVKPVDLPALKSEWLSILKEAEQFIRERPPEEMGCLYYSPQSKSFFAPSPQRLEEGVLHFGRPGGILPKIADFDPREIGEKARE